MSQFEENYNDKHFKYSIAKSIIRLASCLAFFVLLLTAIMDFEMTLKSWSMWAMLFPLGFAIAEILGIMEENI